MNVHEFSSRLRDKLHPAVYRSGVRADAAPFTLLLTHINWLSLGRYALGVVPWDAIKGEPDLLRAVRRATMRHIVTVPYFFQVGVYVVVSGASQEWSARASEVEADRSGFHAVIIQAIHFLDLETGDDLVKRSQWGSVTFGGTRDVTDAIDTVLDLRGRGEFRLRI